MDGPIPPPLPCHNAPSHWERSARFGLRVQSWEGMMEPTMMGAESPWFTPSLSPGLNQTPDVLRARGGSCSHVS